MKKSLIRAASRLPVVLSLLLGACGGVDHLWPFGGEKFQERSRTPANATEYRCNGGKRFFVRYLDDGAAAWLILPDRELRLDRVANTGTRYSNGIAALDSNGAEAALADGSANSFAGCKMVVAVEK